MAKRYEELTISDDFIFGKTMGDKVLCHDVLERMLEKRVGTLEDIQPQREFRLFWRHQMMMRDGKEKLHF